MVVNGDLTVCKKVRGWTPGKGLLLFNFVPFPPPPPGISCLANHVTLKIVGQLTRAPVDDCPLNHKDYHLGFIGLKVDVL